MRHIIGRVSAVIPVMFVVSLVVFSLSHLAPGDPAALIAGRYASAERIAQIHHALGLDQPLWYQYVTWVKNLLQGDFGTSIISNAPVSQLLVQRAGPTLSIAFITIVLTGVVSVPLGVLAAHRVGSWVDRLIMLFSVLAFSVPVFLVGYVFMYGLGVIVPLFPTSGYARLSEGFGPWSYHLALPCVNLALVYIALLTRITRATMLEVLHEDYIGTAYAKGLTVFQVMNHALKNAAVPIVTTIGTSVALMLGGVVVTETVFAIPGIGRLLIDAVLDHDYPVIQSVLFLSAACFVLINLLTDLSYSLFDPRIKY